MPQKFTNFEMYVRVDLQPSWIFREKDVEERLKDATRQCQEISAGIRRHIDDVEGAYIQIDREYECSYCGCEWTEDSSEFNGGCCDEDMKHVPDPEEGI